MESNVALNMFLTIVDVTSAEAVKNVTKLMLRKMKMKSSQTYTVSFQVDSN